MIDILFNLFGLSNNGGKNNKYNIPEKLKILLSPEKKVSLIPYPKMGNIRCGIKFLIEENNIIITLKKMPGAIIKFALEITFIENLLHIILLPMKNKLIKSMGVVLK